MASFEYKPPGAATSPAGKHGSISTTPQGSSASLSDCGLKEGELGKVSAGPNVNGLDKLSPLRGLVEGEFGKVSAGPAAVPEGDVLLRLAADHLPLESEDLLPVRFGSRFNGGGKGRVTAVQRSIEELVSLTCVAIEI